MKSIIHFTVKPIFIAFCLSFSWAGNVLAVDQAIKVGCLFPLAGSGSLYGRDSVEAIKIAQQDLRENKIFSSLKFDVLFGDTRSNVLRSVQIARDFIEKDKVDFLCGVVSSRIALAVTEIAKEHKVFFIGTDHASPRLVGDALHSYYFRVNNDTRQSMQAGAKYIRLNYADKGKLKIAFIGPDYDYGYQAWADLKQFLQQESIDYEVVGEFWPKLFEKDYNIYIHALQDTQADIIVNGQWGTDFIEFVRQAKRFDFFDYQVLMNFDAGGNYETFAELGDDMPLGLVLSARHHVNWPDTEQNNRFVSRFKEQTGRYPSYAAQGAYAGIFAIAHAVQVVGGVNDPDQLRKSLEHLVVKLPEDPHQFSSFMNSDTHQLIQTQAIGKTMLNTNYPPARVLLGDWFIHVPEDEPNKN